MDEKLSEEISAIDRRTGFFWRCSANVATLLGLLGTIVGMIHSFCRGRERQPRPTEATMLSKGISEGHELHGLRADRGHPGPGSLRPIPETGQTASSRA